MNTRLQTRVSRYFIAEEIEQDKETARIVEEAVDIDGEDNVEPKYDHSLDDDDFGQALHGDLNGADENIK